MIHNPQQTNLPLGRMVVGMLAWSALGMTCIAGALAGAGQAAMIEQVFWVGILNVAAFCFGLLPMALAAVRRPDDGIGVGFLQGIVLRSGLSILILVSLTQVTPWSSKVLAVWTAAWYLWLLFFEVAMVGRLLARRDAVGVGEGLA